MSTCNNEKVICNLCFLEIKQHETCYHFARKTGEVEPYHMECYCGTGQGQMGYKPLKVTVNGMEVVPKTL